MSEYEEQEKKYYCIIKKSVMEGWDPIGVKGIEDAQDEYDSYITTICEILTSGKARQELLDYLWWLETEYMGLTGDYQQTEKFAQDLFEIGIT